MSRGIETSHEVWREQLPAYALDALEPDEVAPLAAHLATCDSCTAELAAFQRTVGALAFSPAAAPEPAGARERFARKLAATPAPAVAPRPALAPATAARPGAAGGGLAAWLRSLNPLAGWASAAALGLALIVALVWGVQGRQEATDSAGRLAAAQGAARAAAASADALLALMAAPGGQVITLAGAGDLAQAQARVWIDPATRRAAMVTAGLPAPPAGKVYELWLIRGDQAAPIDVFRPGDGGRSVLTFDVPPGPVAEYSVAALTVESRKVDAPTSQPVMVGKL
jgi:anti-sigma factor RsiW